MRRLTAVLFDLDGVLTPTAEVHMRAWGRLFEPWCEQHGVAAYTAADYFAYIDGKPRFDGVASFIASRGVELPWGDATDEAGDGTVCALGNKKNEIVNRMFVEEGVAPYPGSIAFLAQLDAAGVRTAVVSSSRNARAVLAAAGIADRFDAVVDGEVAEAEHLAGKPAPDTYRRGAELLGIADTDAAVVEDAISGVQAGRAGGFGLVIGVDRGVGVQRLRENGADVVVDDLGRLDASVLELRS